MSDDEKYYTTAEALRIAGVSSYVQLRNYFLSKRLDDPRGRWSAKVVDEFAAGRRRAKLAAKIGYKTTRHLPESFNASCECGAFAVEWNGKIICEKGHIRYAN